MKKIILSIAALAAISTSSFAITAQGFGVLQKEKGTEIICKEMETNILATSGKPRKAVKIASFCENFINMKKDQSFYSKYKNVVEAQLDLDTYRVDQTIDLVKLHYNEKLQKTVKWVNPFLDAVAINDAKAAEQVLDNELILEEKRHIFLKFFDAIDKEDYKKAREIRENYKTNDNLRKLFDAIYNGNKEEAEKYRKIVVEELT